MMMVWRSCSRLAVRVNTAQVQREINRSFKSSSIVYGILQHEWMVQGKVVADGHPSTNPSIQSTVIFLHGLLGNGKNLRNPAKRLTSQNPHISALLLDIRGHGETARNAPPLSFLQPHSISACSNDVFETMQHLTLTGLKHSPIGVIGHSLGGRVAIQYLHDTMFRQIHFAADKVMVCPPKQTWILDSVPGIAHAGVTKVIAAVAALKMPIDSKKQLVASLLNMGIDQTIASWMTTNLKESSNGGFEFSFDLAVAQEILADFSNHDLLQLIRQCLTEIKQRGNQNYKIFLVQGGKNESWTADIVQNIKQMEHIFSGFQRIVLPNAGHWVHVDDLEGLMSVINENLIRPLH